MSRDKSSTKSRCSWGEVQWACSQKAMCQEFRYLSLCERSKCGEGGEEGQQQAVGWLHVGLVGFHNCVNGQWSKFRNRQIDQYHHLVQ